MILEGRKPVVIDRHEPGQAYPRLKITSQVQIPDGLRDRICGRAPRLERTEIEHRLDLDEAAQLLRLRRLAARQDTPRKARGPPGERLAHRIGRHRHGPRQIVERHLPEFHAGQA